MPEKILLLLLIFCGILFQGIAATLSDDDDRESSDLLVREKRVINIDQQGHGGITIEEAKYMTVIKESNRAACAGVILSSHTVITAATCVLFPVDMYHVLSASAFHHWATSHNVTSKLSNYGSNPHQSYDGIALLTVDPPFRFGPKVGNIYLYAGPVRAGTEATVSGWGSSSPSLQTVGLQRRLRQITLPVMDRRQCEIAYRGHHIITQKHICTYHERKFCAKSDIGAPLVINDRLAGIHVIKPQVPNPQNPDIFVDLQLPEYSVWIRQNIRFE